MDLAQDALGTWVMLELGPGSQPDAQASLYIMSITTLQDREELGTRFSDKAITIRAVVFSAAASSLHKTLGSLAIGVGGLGSYGHGSDLLHRRPAVLGSPVRWDDLSQDII